VPFPGKTMYWYENPKGKDELWKEHELWHSACNETPQYVDLFKNGKRVLIMGFQPKGQGEDANIGQMAYFTPGKDPTALWEMHPTSETSTKAHVIPGRFRYSHGLGVGDVNGDGRLDVICTGGWWEQPEKLDDKPWKFHPADLGPDCANMFAFDMDGDGKNDIISSSAHQIGMWWHQQKGSQNNLTFVRNEMLLGGSVVADPKNYLLSADEKKLLDLMNQHRSAKDLRPVRAVPNLCRIARASAAQKKFEPAQATLSIHSQFPDEKLSPENFFKLWTHKSLHPGEFLDDWLEAGL